MLIATTNLSISDPINSFLALELSVQHISTDLRFWVKTNKQTKSSSRHFELYKFKSSEATPKTEGVMNKVQQNKQSFPVLLIPADMGPVSWTHQWLAMEIHHLRAHCPLLEKPG